MEVKWRRELPEGRNPDIRFMAHVWEDLRVLPKPLALHLACEVMSMAGHAVLRLLGFRMDNCQVHCACPAFLRPADIERVHAAHTARSARLPDHIELASAYPDFSPASVWHAVPAKSCRCV